MLYVLSEELPDLNCMTAQDPLSSILSCKLNKKHRNLCQTLLCNFKNGTQHYI